MPLGAQEQELRVKNVHHHLSPHGAVVCSLGNKPLYLSVMLLNHLEPVVSLWPLDAL